MIGWSSPARALDAHRVRTGSINTGGCRRLTFRVNQTRGRPCREQSAECGDLAGKGLGKFCGGARAGVYLQVVVDAPVHAVRLSCCHSHLSIPATSLPLGGKVGCEPDSDPHDVKAMQRLSPASVGGRPAEEAVVDEKVGAGPGPWLPAPPSSIARSG